MLSYLDYLSEASNKNAKVKILVIQGSPRSAKSCSGGDSKTEFLMKEAIKNLDKDVKIDVLNLSVLDDQPKVQPCKGCVGTANGFQCHWPCIEGTQRVHLLNGFKEIKDVKIGDILQDGNKVINHMLTSKNEKIYEIKLNDGRCLRLTSNHKIKTLSKQRYRDKTSNFCYYRKDEWKALKDLSVGDYVPSIETDKSFSNKSNKKDYLYLIYGLLWGDGTLCNNSAILYIDSRQKEFIKHIVDIYKKHIVSILPHNNSNSRLRDNQKNLTQMTKINFGTKIGKSFKKLFTKNKAHERRLNIKSFKNNNQIYNFLNGWISTDGSVNRSKAINIYNTSYNLLRDCQLLLSRISIKSYITDLRHLSTELRGKKYQRCSCLTISDQDSLKIIINNIDLLNSKKQMELNKYNIKKRKLKHYFSKIKSINYIKQGEVYDIEVENSHFFNCEGIKVHNCSCYSPNDKNVPDLMHDENVYKRFKEADGFVVFTPVHWYSCSSQVKALFDRMVCANLTLTVEDAKRLTKNDIKNPKKTIELEQSGKHQNLLKNHLEGKIGAFYIHGNNGADDYEAKKYPLAMAETKHYITAKEAIMPIVLQCRYSGIFVPDHLIESLNFGFNEPYSSSNEKIDKNKKAIDKAIELINNLLKEIKIKNNI